MRLSVLAVVLAVFVVGASGAEATTIQTQDVFDPADVFLGPDSSGVCVGDAATDTVAGLNASGCSSLTFSYTLPAASLVSASLDLYVRDDIDPGNNPEAVRITFNGNAEGEYSIANAPLHFDVLASLTPNGLTVLLERGEQGSGQSDFYFDRGVLNAAWLATDGSDAVDPQASVTPEPASVLLFGLAALAGLMRAQRLMPARLRR